MSEENKSVENNIKRIIGIVSGKGGVGKSLVTAELAVKLRRAGYSVGIMDADITGPSIPKIFGVSGKTHLENGKMKPAVSSTGIKIMSVNLLLDHEDDPVVWRGPILNTMVKRFYEGVGWEELDYLLIDMPPGTSDVPLTVYQNIPLDGIIIVTTPQTLVEMIVKKAYNMAKTMDVHVIALVQNMSYLVCPDCNKRINLFGESVIERLAEELNIPKCASLPIEPDMPALCDSGRIEDFDHADLDDLVTYISE